ncbi:hypothetical protein ACUUL3_16405 [Thiovibrio sp. JS02]
MQSLIRMTIGMVALLVLSGCAVSHKYGPYMGQVVDAETEKPIEGAVIYMEFYTLSSNLAGLQSHFADTKEVFTDENGKFSLEYRVSTIRPGQVWDTLPRTYVFKPGYGVYPGYKGTKVFPKPQLDDGAIPKDKFVTISLVPLATKKERMENLSHLYISPLIPYTKKNDILNLLDDERIYLGLTPLHSDDNNPK